MKKEEEKMDKKINLEHHKWWRLGEKIADQICLVDYVMNNLDLIEKEEIKDNLEVAILRLSAVADALREHANNFPQFIIGDDE